MVQLGGGKKPAKKPPDEELWRKSWGDGSSMGWSAGHSTGHTAQDRVEWRRFDCGIMFQPGWRGWVHESELPLFGWSSLQTSLMKHDTLPFPVWTQSGWGSLCARYPRLEQGWRGSQGCDLSDICIPPHDCSSAPIRLWFQIHQNKTLSISARLLVTLPRKA